MATRVLNTIKDNHKLIGFRIICSLKDKLGEHILNLSQAKAFYKTVEKFENVKYLGNNQWEGLECSIDKFPVQDKTGRFTKLDGKHFILGKMYSQDKFVGYKVMNLSGDVSYISEAEGLNLGMREGFVNAKLVPINNGSSYTISALRGNFRKFDRDKSKDKGNQVVMDEKTRQQHYSILSDMFAAKEKGLMTDADIAKHVGASNGLEYSRKIHEYLGEPLSVSDQDIIKKLYAVHLKKQQSQNVQATSVVKDEPKVVSDKSVVDVKNEDSADIRRMKELIPILSEAADAYYNKDEEIMSNYEYDKLYDELEALEKKTGVILAGSMTQKVGFELVSKLPKVKHPSPMLSLDKTKDRVALGNSLGGQPGFLGWKLDGLTIVLEYENGELKSAVTRGDGKTGEDVTHNAKFFGGVPLRISYTDRLVIRGEALISYKQFEAINAKITKIEDKYKNPRNLASGSVRQLDSAIAKDRGVKVISFTVVEGFDELENYTEKLEELRKYGFDIVKYVKVTKDTTVKAVEYFEELVKTYEYPTDGLVITIDNIAYGESLGTTSKFPRNAKAFKWKDETSDSKMVDIEWSVGRTGAITPVAIFEPVDIEGSTVQRASVHNVSIFKEFKLGKGDVVSIIKSNMIIPQVVENKTKSGTFEIPSTCHICGGVTEIVKSNDAEVLMCTNPNCLARQLGTLSHFVSRDCMNIDGLAESTLERFVNEGYIKGFKDIYHLNDYENDIIKLDGFGRGSYTKLWKAIEKSRECELPAFISALGIAQMGKSTSKDVCKALDYDLEALLTADEDKLKSIGGVGDKTAHEIAKYFEKNADMVRELAKELTFKAMPKIDRNSPIAGKTFCITGDVFTFKNRKELQAKIESLGAKAASSVSAKTDYLINNDVTSGSNKNQKAKQLGVPIISEQDFLNMIGE